MPHLDQHLLRRLLGKQVELKGCAAMGFDFIAQQAGDRVDQAAFDAGGSRNKFALAAEAAASRVGKTNRDRFKRLAGETAGEMRRPAGLG